MLSHALDPGRAEGEAPGMLVAREAQKKPMGWISAGEEVPFGVEGYDDGVNSSRVKDDMEVFGRGARSEATCDCDSADGRNGILEID